MTAQPLDGAALDWKTNATVYHYDGATSDYSFTLIVSHNPYNGEWVWNTAVKYLNSDHMCFYDFGEATTAGEGQRLSRDAFERWQRSGSDEPGGGDGVL